MDGGASAVLAIGASLVPIIFFVRLFASASVRRDPTVPSSTRLAAAALLGMIAATALAAAAHAIASALHWRSELVSDGVLAPLAEESGKALAVAVLLVGRPRSRLAGLRLGFMAGLGFAALENVLAAVAALGSAGLTVADITQMRLVAMVVHGTCGAVGGAAVAMVGASRWAPPVGLAGAVALHAMWNLMLHGVQDPALVRSLAVAIPMLCITTLMVLFVQAQRDALAAAPDDQRSAPSASKEI